MCIRLPCHRACCAASLKVSTSGFHIKLHFGMEWLLSIVKNSKEHFSLLECMSYSTKDQPVCFQVIQCLSCPPPPPSYVQQHLGVAWRDALTPRCYKTTAYVMTQQQHQHWQFSYSNQGSSCWPTVHPYSLPAVDICSGSRNVKCAEL